MFERDLRLWAKKKKCVPFVVFRKLLIFYRPRRAMKFDSSGITRLRDTKSIFAKNEQEVFDILGLEWIEPTLRNAD